MSTAVVVNVRVDEVIKTQASEALAAMGMSMSDAIRIFLHRVVAEQAFPLELKVPNAQTRAAIAEARALMAQGAGRAMSAEELFDALDGKNE